MTLLQYVGRWFSGGGVVCGRDKAGKIFLSFGVVCVHPNVLKKKNQLIKRVCRKTTLCFLKATNRDIFLAVRARHASILEAMLCVA